MATLYIQYLNGSVDALEAPSATAAYDFARTRLSFSRIMRVELVPDDSPGTAIAMWDARWDSQSKIAGLQLAS